MKKPIKIITKNAEETKKLGKKLAQKIQNERSRTSIRKEAFIISLEGELGSGKTTFTQGCAKGLGIRENPRSPTFVIMRVYELNPADPYPNHSPFVRGNGKKKNNPPPYEAGSWGRFIHIDAYRITSKDLKAIGWQELIKNPKNIILIEWGDRIFKALPRDFFRVKFNHGHLPHERTLQIFNSKIFNFQPI